MPKKKATEGPSRQKLTKTACDRAKYPHDPDTEKRHVIWDTECRGFGLRVYASGRRVFVFRGKLAGRQRWLQIGDFGPMTVDGARKRAETMRVQINDGKDPVEVRKQKVEELKRQHAEGTTVADLAADYIRAASTRKEKPIKAATVESYENYAAHVKAAFGSKRPREITEEKVKKWYDDMDDERVGANRRLWLLSALMDDALRRGLRSGPNPCKNAVGRKQKYSETKRKRYLKADELARLGNALRDLEGQPGGVSVSAAGVVRWMLATGCRKGEALRARWEDIDVGEEVWRVREAKAGPRDVLMNASALAVLATVPRIEGNPYVFPGKSPGGRLTTIQTPWKRLCKAAKIKDCRPHDLRHTVGSYAVSSGASMKAVAGVLGHADTSSTERYAHMQDSPIREASERAVGGIFAVLDGETNEPDEELR